MAERRAWRRPWALYSLVLVLVVIVIVIGWFCWFYPVTTVLIVRHAERANSEDDLKQPEGVDRAAKLVHVAGSAGITAIYHSDTTRTRKTAQDLADHLGLTPVELPAADTEQLVDRILSDHRGERVFVVGHSNTVPDIIEGLGGGAMPNIPHFVYDNLFVVTLCRCTWRSVPVVNLKYGAPTPP